MREAVTVLGMVLLSAPSGDYDRRLVLLTAKLGKITVFAHGARRPGNALMASSRTFTFGYYTVYEGRSAYNLQSAQILNYFEQLSSDMEGACYGSYFLETAALVSQENMDCRELLTLLYQSLRAILSPSIPNRLARRIFELKVMVLNGEYTELPTHQASDSCCYAWEYVVLSPVEKLYQFNLKKEVLQEFEREVESARGRYLKLNLKSLEILEAMT